MVTKDLQTLNLKFDQVMFNSLILTWKRNFEVTFGILSVLVFQINVRESYLDIYLFSLRSGNFIMFLKTNLGYLSQIALKNMQLLILISEIPNP